MHQYLCINPINAQKSSNLTDTHNSQAGTNTSLYRKAWLDVVNWDWDLEATLRLDALASQLAEVISGGMPTEEGHYSIHLARMAEMRE